MKFQLTKLLKALVAGAAFLAVGSTLAPTTAQAGPADDLVAIYLGSLLRGTGTNIGSLTPADQAAALISGRNAFRSTITKPQPLATGASIPVGGVQGAAFQNLLLQATELALTQPTTLTIPATIVTLTNGKTARVSATLNPTRVRASQIINFMNRRLPNYTPLFAFQGVEAAFSTTSVTPYVPVFNYKGANEGAIQLAQLRDAAKLAAANLRAGIRTYPNGTINASATQLVNMTTNAPILTRWSAAIAAQAVRGLPNDLDIPGSSFVYDRAASMVTNSLVRAANSLMKLNPNAVQSIAVGGVYSVSGISNALWNDTSNADVTAALNGVAFGAITGARKHVVSIAQGLASAFSATFFANGGAEAAWDPNENANREAIYNVILFALKTIKPDLQTQIQNAITAGFNLGKTAAARMNIPGFAGLNEFVYDSSGPAPVTDIVGF